MRLGAFIKAQCITVLYCCLGMTGYAHQQAQRGQQAVNASAGKSIHAKALILLVPASQAASDPTLGMGPTQTPELLR